MIYEIKYSHVKFKFVNYLKGKSMSSISILEQIQQRYNKSLLNKKEAAQELGISQASLDRLRKSGEIRSKRVGGKVMISLKEIALFIGE